MLEQGRFLPEHRSKLVKALIEDLGDLHRDGHTLPLQGLAYLGQILTGLLQGVVMVEEPCTRAQHVAVELGIVENEGIERLMHALDQRGVEALALEQEIGEEQEQTANDGKL